MAVVALAMVGGAALAATDAETVALFKKADRAPRSSKSYGYAVFPTIGKGGIGVGGAYGKGSVYQGGKYMGDVIPDPGQRRLSAGR